MLVRCLYASRRATPSPQQEVDGILAQCRKNNPAWGLTGLLCVADDLFLQVLEGGRDEVCELFNRILRDERHGHVRILLYEEISERKFGNWSMGQVSADRINPALLLKYFRRAALDPFECSGRSSLALLTELIDTAALTLRGD